jgi:hypothetical protein
MTRATFDEGFKLAVRYFAADELANSAATVRERCKWSGEARRLGNKITPAAKQAAAPVHREVANEALRWYQQNGSKFNFSVFIAHCRTRGIGQRRSRKSGLVRLLGDSAIRKIVTQKLGITGKAGRPVKG